MKRPDLRPDVGAERGIALVTTLLVMLLLSALLAGFLTFIGSDQRASYQSRDQSTAYAAAHGGLETLTASLGELFATSFRPSAAQVEALMDQEPEFPANVNAWFEAPGGGDGYRIRFTDANADGFPDPEPQPRQIMEGAYQGLQGIATPFTIEVTARTATGAETRMRRQMFTMLIPAFQFGIFSENDLSFFAGPTFDFGGAVHTNQNLFLAEGDNNTLWLRDRVTAVGEVVRLNLSNGHNTSSSYNGTVRIARYSGDTVGATMLRTEGSWAANAPQLPPEPEVGVTPAPGENLAPNWTSTSVTKFRGNLKNARTGAKLLVLPLAQMGATPIDLIRRPDVNSDEDTTNPAIFGQRYYAQASVRILLSDREEDLTDLPGVTATAPVNLAAVAGIAAAPPAPAGWWNQTNGRYESVFPVAGTWTAAQERSRFYPGALPNPIENYYAGAGVYRQAGQPAITGFLKIELQRQDRTWVDVTQEILNLGFRGRRLSQRNPGTAVIAALSPLANFAGSYLINDYTWGSTPNVGNAPPCAEVDPDAVIRIQRVRDDHNPNYACGMNGAAPSPNAFDFVPNVLFDPREGNRRDTNANTTQTVYLGGVMHYIELDVRNLSRWLSGAIGSGAGLTAEDSDGGYVVYFSDRRTNQRVDDLETAELGFEDIINPNDQNDGVANNVLDAGEDVNGIDRDGNGSNLDRYGSTPIVAPNLRTGVPDLNAMILRTQVTSRVARSNSPIFFRRGLKLVNAAGTAANANVSPLTLLPAARGLTIVAENPVYVQGNFNTGTAGNFGASQNDHRPAAVIADAVTLLSNSWNDLRSFNYLNSSCPDAPANAYADTCFGAQVPSLRRASLETWYRMAVVSGKVLSFPKPNWATDAQRDFGTDGGAHNFLRYIEDWAGTRINYRGSILSFFTSRQAIGTYKCCVNVYGAPDRGYRFDTEFLQLSLLPPKPPAFRDVNTYEFRQILRPTQE